MLSEVLVALGIATSMASAAEVTSDHLASIEDRYRDSVVQVRYTQHVTVSTAEPAQEEELTTTGLVVSPDGVVMVSGIVFEPFTQVPHGVGIRFPSSVNRAEAEIREAWIRVGGSEYPGSFLGRDMDADVAFFRIEAGERTFRPVVFETVPLATVGQEVVVISRLPAPLEPALALELTRVQAVVSKPAEGFIVATGAADPVGSLVCDLEGTPLGMLDALMVPMPQADLRNPLAVLTVLRSLPKGVGRGFARPAARFAAAAAGPPEASPMRRGWLGVEMQALTPELAAHMKLPVASGVIVGYVYRRSPAERAGLTTGDILIDLEGEPIDVTRDDDLGGFSERLLKAGADARLRLGYLRGGDRYETVATLAPAPKTRREAETVEVEELDLTVRELTFDYLARENLEPDTSGVVVQDPPVVVRTNPNRIVRGDLLVKIGESEVSDLASFRQAVATLRQERPEEVILFVERGRESFFFAVKPDWN